MSEHERSDMSQNNDVRLLQSWLAHSDKRTRQLEAELSVARRDLQTAEAALGRVRVLLETWRQSADYDDVCIDELASALVQDGAR